MPTRITVTKDEEVSEAKRLRQHALMSASPQQIENYIENNVNNMAEAKEVLKLLAKMVVLLGRNR